MVQLFIYYCHISHCDKFVLSSFMSLLIFLSTRLFFLAARLQKTHFRPTNTSSYGSVVTDHRISFKHTLFMPSGAVCVCACVCEEERACERAAMAASVSQRDQKWGLPLRFQMSSTDIMAALIQAN